MKKKKKMEKERKKKATTTINEHVLNAGTILLKIVSKDSRDN